MRKNSTVRLLPLLTTFTFLMIACAQQDVRMSDPIRLNQTGFYPNASKIAIVPGDTDGDHEHFYLYTPDLKTQVYEGHLSEARKSPYSSSKVRIADFTSFTDTGRFVVMVPDHGQSYPFQIRNAVHEDVLKASLKGFYYQRFGMELEEKYAGKWKRPSSPSDDRVMIHASAASKTRPEGTTLASPGGWIDAGDYNKYIVNSGITTATLLSAYEDFPSYYDQLNTNIPESGNSLPDILDETLWNLRWMLTMQDPEDGGVYHKCTNANFDPMVMPHQATTQRYVVQKGTGAALNFAAVTAQAARVLRKFESELPGLADTCLQASQRAWLWAVKNPDVEYDQNAVNSNFDPDVNTGGYGDNNFLDEFLWAACELLVTTGSPDFVKDIAVLPDDQMPIPGWNQVRLLGYYTLVRAENALPSELAQSVKEIKSRIVSLADKIVEKGSEHYYLTAIGPDKSDFVWGSNAVAANQAIALIQAYRISNNKQHLTFALHNLDYLLGRNATGYCFLTGFGEKSPMHIHHRPSEADGIAEPVPGLLAGGPNPGMQDKCDYASSAADEAYVDHVCSYASNEIAINWNAPFVYLAGAIEALH